MHIRCNTVGWPTDNKPISRTLPDYLSVNDRYSAHPHFDYEQYYRAPSPSQSNEGPFVAFAPECCVGATVAKRRQAVKLQVLSDKRANRWSISETFPLV
jgi:hypothetical protein